MHPHASSWRESRDDRSYDDNAREYKVLLKVDCLPLTVSRVFEVTINIKSLHEI
jgi:hypothetical protein